MNLLLRHPILSNQKLRQLIRFIITGFVGLIIDFFITWLCKEHFGWNKYIANATGFSFAVVNNYILNRLWAFRNRSKKIAKQFISFFIISIVGLCLSTLFLYLIHQELSINFYISKAMVVIIVFIWNYTANSLITFKKI